MSHRKSGSHRRVREVSEFKQCTICESVINSQFAVTHSEVCNESAGKWLNSECVNSPVKCLKYLTEHNDKYAHSFIKCGRYYGSVVARNDRMAENLKYIPEVYRQRCVVVHTQVAKQCKLMRGDLVILCNDRGDQIVLLLWPSDVVKIENVALSDEMISTFRVKPGDWVEIKKFNCAKVSANEIVLKPTSKIQEKSTEIFTRQIYHSHNGHFFAEGNKLLLHNLDGIHEFEVLKITGLDDEVNSISALEHSFSDVSIVADDDSVLLNSDLSLNFTPLKLTTSCQDSIIESNNESQEEFLSPICNSVPAQFCTPTVKFDETNSCGTIQRKSEFYYINQNTKILFETENDAGNLENENQTVEIKLGGLTQELELLKKLCGYKLLAMREGFELLNWTGILIHGVSGVGKTLLVQKLAAEINWNLICVKSWEIYNKCYGESERRLRTIFSDAKERAPSIIFFDKIDVLCSKRNETLTDLETRVTSALKSEIENLQNKTVVVIGSVYDVERIDPNLRRPGIFDKEIKLSVPTKNGRFEIIKILLNDVSHELSDSEILQLADDSPGFVGSDLANLCTKAKLCTLKQQPKPQSQDENNSNFKSYSKLTINDFNFALKLVRPNTIRDFSLRIPKVTWEDIAVDPDVKEKLVQSIIWPLKNPQILKENQITASHGVLLFGPPGCSKTLIATALANESGFNFLAIKGPELYDKYVGETEKAVKAVFERAKMSAPTILFIDEFDGLVSGRGSGSEMEINQVENRVRSILLTEINGIDILDGVAIIAATNRPETIDEALLRAGRLGTKIYIPLPNENIRRQIFQIQFRKRPISEDVDLDELISRTEKFSGAQVVQICHQAARLAMIAHLPSLGTIDMNHFRQALGVTQPNVSEALIRTNEEFYLRSVR